MMPQLNKNGAPLHIIEGEAPLPIHYIGPHLEEGPLPTLFYFALTAEESLTLDPYNQPALLASAAGMRCFSFTLPYHGKHFERNQAMALWAKELEHNGSFFEDFLARAAASIDFLERKGALCDKQVAVAGLSRGAFIAAHLAARHDAITHLLGFSPLTQLKYLREFKPLIERESVERLKIELLLPLLRGKKVFFLIGNRDQRVGSGNAFAFIEKLAEENYRPGHRSPPVELYLFPSIGHQGHGTPREVFQRGIDWLAHSFAPE